MSERQTKVAVSWINKEIRAEQDRHGEAMAHLSRLLANVQKRCDHSWKRRVGQALGGSASYSCDECEICGDTK